MKLKTRRIGKAKLLGLKPKGGWEPYFSFARQRSSFLVKNLRANTHRNLYPRLNEFLERHKKEIKVFADVGAGNAGEAPTTQAAKEILGREAAVYAVDVYRSPYSLSHYGITEVLLAIQKKPLPFKCDAIRWAQMSQRLLKKEVISSLKNIWLSLRPGGYLLGGSEISAEEAEFIADRHQQFVLKKVRKTKTNPLGFVEIQLPRN